MLKNIFYLLPASCVSCRNIIFANKIICADCFAELPWLLPTDLSISNALFHYQPPIDDFITQLKFNGKLMYAKFFSDCVIDQLQKRSTALPQALIPMPLHRQRLQERGFNQALAIAKPLAKKFKIPILHDFCYRQKYTQPQTTLSAKARITNVKNAFAIKKSYQLDHVAIIDDVITTGNTLSALQTLLIQQGVKKIEVWCVAKAGQ